MKGKTGTISYLWTSISNSLNTKGDREHFFRHIDTSWRQVAGFKIHCWLRIIYIILKLLYLTDFKSRRCIIFWVINKNESCFSLWVYFQSISFTLTILAIAVQETFKTTIGSVGGQDCIILTELCAEGSVLTVLHMAVGAEQAGCCEHQYLAHAAWHWAPRTSAL